MKELTGLTGLRFLAAFYVFLFHVQLRIGTPLLWKPLTTIISQGALGVNLFFALSGFLLTYSHLKDFSTPHVPSAEYMLGFMWKRFARIYPSYVAGLVLYILLRLYAHDFTPYFAVVTGASFSLLQGWYTPMAMEWYGSMAWSISAEIAFYLLFPFILPSLLLVRSRRTLLLLLAGVILLAYLPGFVYSFQPANFPLFQAVYTFPLLRLPEFVSGMIAMLLLSRFSWRVPEWVAISLVAFATIYLATLGNSQGLQGFVVHNLVVLPAIISLLCVLTDTEHTRLLKWIGSKPLVYFGKVSYSFYIFQIPLLLLLDIFLTRYPELATSNIIWSLTFVCNLLGAVFLYEVVERRMHKKLLAVFFKYKKRRMELAADMN